MITVDEALAKVLDLSPSVAVEQVPLGEAAGRVLIQPVQAGRDQPPFAASAMDGYAVQAKDVAAGAVFKVIGESSAGHGFSGTVVSGQAVRIFTGAPVPAGADRVIIQEDVSTSNDTITLNADYDQATYVRPAAADFATGTTVFAPRVLNATDIALMAAMNIATLPVACRPVVALIATGDELVMPGEAPGPDQIIASNTFGLAAMIERAGAIARILPIARDTENSLMTAFALAKGADLIVTVGGASVGDHDLVAPVAEQLGMKRAFYKIAMRPGKPLMAGRLEDSAMIGLPGNPVSSLVCCQLFIVPFIRAALGLGKHPVPRQKRPLAVDLPDNGKREHYMRATLTDDGITPLDRQDSSLLSALAQADALLVRPVNDSPRKAGETVEFIPL